MGGIFFLSSLPGDQLPLPDFALADKLAHFATYSVLGVLLAFRGGLTDLVHRRPVKAWTKGGWIAPGIGMLYGLLDEIHQLYTPDRTFDLKDLAVNCLGIALGFWLARRWDATRQSRRTGTQ